MAYITGKNAVSRPKSFATLYLNTCICIFSNSGYINNSINTLQTTAV